MIQKVKQRGAVFRLQQFPSSNAVEIELSLYLVMGPFIPFRAIVSESQQKRNGGMKSSIVCPAGCGIRQRWFATQKRFRRPQIFPARSQYSRHDCSAIFLAVILL